MFETFSSYSSPEPRNAPARDVPGEELDFRNEALNALRMEELLKESLGESSLEKKLSWKRETGGKKRWNRWIKYDKLSGLLLKLKVKLCVWKCLEDIFCGYFELLMMIIF